MMDREHACLPFLLPSSEQATRGRTTLKSAIKTNCHGPRMAAMTPDNSCGIAPHGPDRGTVRKLDLAGKFEAEALIDRDVRVLAGLEIAGRSLRVRNGKLVAHDEAPKALALFRGIGADRLQVPMRFF